MPIEDHTFVNSRKKRDVILVLPSHLVPSRPVTSGEGSRSTGSRTFQSVIVGVLASGRVFVYGYTLSRLVLVSFVALLADRAQILFASVRCAYHNIHASVVCCKVLAVGSYGACCFTGGCTESLRGGAFFLLPLHCSFLVG